MDGWIMVCDIIRSRRPQFGKLKASNIKKIKTNIQKKKQIYIKLNNNNNNNKKKKEAILNNYGI